MEVKVINKSQNELPRYASERSAGVDLQADFSEGISDKFFSFAAFDEVANVINIFPGGRALVPTNLFTDIPLGYEIQVRPRSGLALKKGISVLNTPGTIDGDYRGNWGVILINLGESDFQVAQGDRIAQAVLSPVAQIEWVEVKELDETKRGAGGFGDSGTKNESNYSRK
jgi:dUTP pyrophosphatase